MAHLSGTYSYTFTRLEPMYNNSLKTGCQSLVVGLSCSFTGYDANGVQATGQSNASGYAICYTPEYVSGNISGLANEYVSGLGWLHILEDQISGKLHTPVRWDSFPFPYLEGTGEAQHSVPGVNPEDA